MKPTRQTMLPTASCTNQDKAGSERGPIPREGRCPASPASRALGERRSTRLPFGNLLKAAKSVARGFYLRSEGNTARTSNAQGERGEGVIRNVGRVVPKPCAMLRFSFFFLFFLSNLLLYYLSGGRMVADGEGIALSICFDCAKYCTEACHNFRGDPNCPDFYLKEDWTPSQWKPRYKSDPGEYLDEPAEPTIATKVSVKQQSSSPNIYPHNEYVRVGQQLFYKDKRTAKIESGIVAWRDSEGFIFTFDHYRRAHLPFSSIGTRLFYTPEGARKG